jgi:hypothetical protein
LSKVKYRYDTRSLTYEKVEVTWTQRILKFLSYLGTGLVFAVAAWWAGNFFLGTPGDKKTARELEEIRFQYKLLQGKMTLMTDVLKDLEDRDNNIYRVIFEAEPISDQMRKAGFGGVDRYRKLEGYTNSELMIEAAKKADALSKRMYIQSKSFDEVIKMARNKQQLINSIPAIMPVNNKNLRHQPGGFGWRTHPIYKTSEFHPGMDFACPEGTPIYSTGDGVVERADNTAQGYGNHVVVNHGYGYQTLYGHMTKTNVTPGQKIKRGQVIGFVGSTGLSTAPHVHYEVIKNGEKVNPINFYYNDLSPEEYKILVELSANTSQSFD